jgi:hypothetical protein
MQEAGKTNEELTIPILLNSKKIDEPILSRMISQAHTIDVGAHTRIRQYNTKDLANSLGQAVKSQHIEPLASLLYTALNTGKILDEERFLRFLKPYIYRLSMLATDASHNILLEPQAAHGNIFRDMMLANGKLLLKVCGQFQAYKYHIEKGTNPVVVYSPLPGLNTKTLEDAVEKVSEPSLVESIVLAKARKPYSVRSTILPFYAYQLLGVNLKKLT